MMLPLWCRPGAARQCKEEHYQATPDFIGPVCNLAEPDKAIVASSLSKFQPSRERRCYVNCYLTGVVSPGFYPVCTVKTAKKQALFHLRSAPIYVPFFLHKSGKDGLAKKENGWKSLLSLTLWNPSSHE
jgi:hypothetical protein